ncbi:MAG: AAA family ATPase [Rhodospirillales bacterium]|nr:AAA family ATPase [Rhodospirillales bacterium]
MTLSDQSEVIAFLSRAEAFGVSRPPRRCETHASIVFIAGDRAYKLKRAVRYPYLDFSTPERRHAFCEAEVRINRRTAPMLYRGVVAVTRDAGGRLCVGGAGEPVDWLVEMARFDDDALFAAMADRSLLTREVMEDLADHIAAFHRDAEPRLLAGGSAALAAVIANNAESLATTDLDPGQVGRLIERWRASLTKVAARLEQRREQGLVRRCHGDLHLRNIVLIDGRATLFDAIEFDDVFAEIDVLYDLAFLLMDLRVRGRDDLASLVLNRYLDNAGGSDGLAALPLFLSLRAGVRAIVDATAARAHSDPAEARRLLAGAQRYLDWAEAALAPVAPRLVAVGGLSGSGKSKLARALAPGLGSGCGARVVRTDAIRKRLAGVPLTARLGADGYSREMTQRTYLGLYDECAAALAAGCAVIADAVFAAPEERAAVGALAACHEAPFAGLWLEAPMAVLEERVKGRRGDISDADLAVVRLQADYDLGEIDWARIDSSGPAEATLAAARRKLQAALAAAGEARARPSLSGAASP